MPIKKEQIVNQSSSQTIVEPFRKRVATCPEQVERVRKEFDFSCLDEAIRKVSSLEQSKNSVHKYKNFYKLPCKEFLSWFLGFSEGDGSFVIIKRNTACHFVITQSTDDLEILNFIQESLGFGRVCKQGKRTSRYVVQDRRGLYILFSLFNGNLIFPRRKAQFKKWAEWGNLGSVLSSSQRVTTREKDVPIIDSEILPALDNGWISGLTDSEGCFTASFLSNSTAFRLRFILSQKGDDNLPILSHFIELFQGGAIEAHSIKSNYSYILSGVGKCYNIYRYFSRFPLKSKKAKSFHLWKSLHASILRKDHLVTEKRVFLSEKAKIINSIRRKSK